MTFNSLCLSNSQENKTWKCICRLIPNISSWKYYKKISCWVCPQPTTVSGQPMFSVRQYSGNQSLMCLQLLDHDYVRALKSILGLRVNGIKLFGTSNGLKIKVFCRISWPRSESYKTWLIFKSLYMSPTPLLARIWRSIYMDLVNK